MRALRIRALLVAAALGLACASTLSSAEVPPEQGPPPQPAGRGQGPGRGGGRGAPPVRSPEVGSDLRVTFRLRAPNAKDVGVSLAGKTLPMQKDDQGVWSMTTDALAPNYYTYSIVVDGTSINDPSNRTVQTGWNGFQSMFAVPGPDPWLPAAGVPRGTISRHRFRSDVAGDERDFFVYTPAGYDPRRSRPYPTLYLLHGLGDDAERWMNGGAAPVIFDNLIAQGKAVPTVVVTTLGYGTSAGPNADSAAIVTGYTKILLGEVMPLVEKTYNVSRNRDQRAIAGLSMGGAEAIYTALNHVDRFAWVGSFSGAFVMWPRDRQAEAPPAPPAAPGAPGGRGRGGAPLTPAALDTLYPGVTSSINSRLRLLWISCGTADSLLGVNRQFKDWLRSKNVRFVEEEAENVGHVWPLWRKDLVSFAQRAFK